MATVLIVDDSPTDVRIISGMLQRHGYQVLVAGSAEEGIAIAKSSQPALILMDVIMPGMNGFQATRSLSRDPATAHIPVIIVTTKNMDTDRVWGLRQGAKEFISKPLNEALLIERIKQFLPS